MKLYLSLHPRFGATSIGAVVQLVRMPACHAGGRGFESLPHRKQLFRATGGAAFFVYGLFFRSGCVKICDQVIFESCDQFISANISNHFIRFAKLKQK